ncbi:hypothetical protein AAFF_G00232500 [Aldrovandia affinis]|uniref:Uncharacterized protein n=1 Tax=Aldrovandia affinis TaxID=143900 RepID=A0AAD7RF63_9TELE|nr:hypothetical protein AAFF_G00232500 [Aldrovandia affinis]
MTSPNPNLLQDQYHLIIISNKNITSRTNIISSISATNITSKVMLLLKTAITHAGVTLGPLLNECPSPTPTEDTPL